MSRPDIEDAMRGLAAAAVPGAPPDADLIWRRAAVRARWRQYDRATRSIRVAEAAACVVCAATGAAALAALGPGIGAALGSLHPAVLLAAGGAAASSAMVGAALVRVLGAGD
jgi:hypothetical protein